MMFVKQFVQPFFQRIQFRFFSIIRPVVFMFLFEKLKAKVQVDADSVVQVTISDCALFFGSEMVQ